MDKLFLDDNDLYIDYQHPYPINPQPITIKHIQDVNAGFTFESGKLYPIMFNQKICGSIWEDIIQKEDIPELHFAIYTYGIRGLNIVQKYLQKKHKYKLYLHTTPRCNIIDFYKQKHDFSLVHSEKNHIVLTKKQEEI